MDWLITVDLEESVIEKIDRTAKRLGKTRMEVTNELIKLILHSLEAEKNAGKINKKSEVFSNSKEGIDH